MIRYATKKFEMQEILNRFDDDIREWFHSNFYHFTPPQRLSIPLIDRQTNLLISSPTGTGKTLTAFLSIINHLYELAKQGKLQNRTYCVYVSPLKALGRDIGKNLVRPLDEIYGIARERIRKGTDQEKKEKEIEKLMPQKIRVGTRTGDTSSKEKQRMVRKPPHILITTPETLAIVLSTSKFIKKLGDIEYVIVDEIHDLASSKRGTLLSLSLERLQNIVGKDIVRIGLSATQSPIEEIARFLGGRAHGKERDVTIVEYKGKKRHDLGVIPAFDSFNQPYKSRLEKAVEIIASLMEEHGTTLIFTNTREMSEKIPLLLKKRGTSPVATHHGSLGKETRFEIEDKLKKGELKGVATSSSLELGIDVGYINLVIQVGSPKSIARAIQRIGRAGHELGRVAKGRLIAMELDELLECCAIARCIKRGKMDDISMPRESLDVLSQAVVGMTLEGEATYDEMFDVVKGSMVYSDLRSETFRMTLSSLSDQELAKYGIYPRIQYDEGEEVIKMNPSARLIYYLNVGTIPPQMEYKVRRAEDDSYIGTLSDSFVERLTKNDVFLLGGRSYRFIKSVGSLVYVKHAGGITPTVPSWSGQFITRSTDLSVDVGRFLSTLEASLSERANGKGGGRGWSSGSSSRSEGNPLSNYDENLIEDLEKGCSLSSKGCELLLNYITTQLFHASLVPSARKILVEGYIDNLRMKNVIIHSVFGRKINEAVARALAALISEGYGGRVKYSIHDNGIVLTLEEVGHFQPYEIFNMLHSQNIEDALMESLKDGELLKRRFLHCANRALTILKNYKGRKISIKKQQLQALDILRDVPSDTLGDLPPYREAYNEILNQYMDIEGAKRLLNDIARGDILVYSRDYSPKPSIFAYSLIVPSLGEVSSLRSKTMVFKQLGGELFEEIVGYGSSRYLGGTAANFSRKMVDVHFKRDASFYKGVKRFKRRAEEEYEEVLDRIDSGKLDEKAVPMSRVEIIKDQVREFLEVFGPFTERELQTHFDYAIRNINLTTILSELEKEADVMKDDIIEGDSHEYYILRRDLRTLQLIDEGKFTLTQREFVNFLSSKFFDTKGNLEEWIDSGDAIGSPLNISKRTKRFTRRKWISAIENGRLVQARLLRSKAWFLPMERLSKLVWSKRKTSLNPVEQGLLKYVRENRGAKRYELYKKLDFSKGRIYEALYHLEKNLWLGRSRLPSSDSLSAVGFVYIPNEDFDKLFLEEEGIDFLDEDMIKEDVAEWVSDSHMELVRYILEMFGPISKSGLQEYSGFYGEDLDNILADLISGKEARNIFVENPHPTAMLVTAEDYRRMKEGKEGDVKDRNIREIISDTHPYFHLVRHKAFIKFTDVWSHLLIEDNEPVAALRLEREKDSLTVLNIEIPVESPEKRFAALGASARSLPEENDEVKHVLKVLAGEMAELLKFYSRFDIDVIKVEMFNGVLIENIVKSDSWLVEHFEENGLLVMDDKLVMGDLIGKTYPFEKVLKYVFYKQHVHPDTVVEDPTVLIEDLTSFSSTEELRLRCESSSITLNSFAKNNDLVKAKLVPPRQMYTTRDLIKVFKSALKQRVSKTAKYLLSVMPSGFVVNNKKWRERATVSKSVFQKKKKELIDALYVVKDTKNSYVKVEDEASLSKRKARRRCIKWLFEAFGVFTLPRLKDYVRNAYSLEELREILNYLVGHGYLVKGYLVKDSSEIYYLLKEEMELLDDVEMYGKFILPPKDPLWYYLQDDIRNDFGRGSWYVVFKGGEMAAGFKGKPGKKVFRVKEYKGDDMYKFMIEKWIWRQGLDVKGLDD